MRRKSLNNFRISKYNSKLRESGSYLIDEWTSYTDIGRCFRGKETTLSDYEKIENAYLAVITCICAMLNITKMQVVGLEDLDNMYPFEKLCYTKDIDGIITIARDCLREKYWCKLVSDDLELHFGYDYYLYVCTSSSFSNIKKIADSVGLFVESYRSPYR